MPEMGEYVVGAYLKLVKGCQHVMYNVRQGKQSEVDVVGIDLRHRVVCICEVKTHIGGLLISKGGADVTGEKIRKQLENNVQYGRQWSRDFTPKYMFWSPYVPAGKRMAQLQAIETRIKPKVELIVNSEYTKRVEELQKMARHDDSTSGEPFYRALQIIEHMRD